MENVAIKGRGGNDVQPRGPQQEKPICPNRKNSFLQNTKNPKSTKINSRKNFVPHGIPMQASASPEQPLRCCPEPLDLPGLPVVSF